MRWVLCFLLAAGGAWGCAAKKSPVSYGAPSSAAAPDRVNPRAPPLVTPGGVVSGRVVSVNLNGRFVVLSYPLGTLPTMERRLSVYRGSLKVGEVRVSRWQLDNLVVADILAGECRVGDEARED